MGRNKSTISRELSRHTLDVLLKKGAKSMSIGWDFSANIERAKEQGFEPIELIVIFVNIL
jgi:IS30 family transposase